MPFDDPIYLDRDSFEELMVDTDEHRLCWMYHDLLSSARIAWLLDESAGKGSDVHESWASMAWVAAGHQPGSFYLLYKWYEDSWGPPQRSDLYYVEPGGSAGDLRVRALDQSFREKLNRRELAWCDSFPARVSRNAAYFFGDQDFWISQMETLLQVAQSSPGQELAAFDRYFGRRPDGEKAMLGGTMSAYFHSIEAVRSVLYGLLESDGRLASAGHYLGAEALLAALRPLTDAVDVRMLPDLTDFFEHLAQRFYEGPSLGAYLTRQAGRILETRTESGQLRWLRLNNQSGRMLLRELYCRCAPSLAWDVFHRWNGALYFTALRRPLGGELPRGVCVLARFEDQTGRDVTSLFWLSNVTGGEVRLCEGEFLEDLLDQLLDSYIPTVDLPVGRLWEAGDVAACSFRLQDAFYHYYRGRS